MFDETDIISSYSRADAIADGVLIDVTETARQAGFKFPIAVTAEAWGTLEPTEEARSLGQSESGRLWDLLNVMRWKIRSGGSGSRIDFKIAIDEKGAGRTKDVAFKSICGPGDNMEPVITILLPWED